MNTTMDRTQIHGLFGFEQEITRHFWEWWRRITSGTGTLNGFNWCKAVQRQQNTTQPLLCEDGSALAKVPHGSKIKKRCIIAIDTLVLDLDQRTTKVRGIEKGIRCIFVSNEHRNQQNATGQCPSAASLFNIQTGSIPNKFNNDQYMAMGGPQSSVPKQ